MYTESTTLTNIYPDCAPVMSLPIHSLTLIFINNPMGKKKTLVPFSDEEEIHTTCKR